MLCGMEQRDDEQCEQTIALLGSSGPLFFALGDGARQEIVALLARHGRLNVGELTSYTTLSRPAVSHHLKILRDAGLLNERREGVRRYYYPALSGAAVRLEQLAREVRHTHQLMH